MAKRKFKLTDGERKDLHQRAMEMYVDGGNLQRIARHLKVAPQTVAYWVSDVAEALPNAPVPEEVKEAEMDELFTFIGDKKQNLHYHCGRSQDSLYFGLGRGLDPHPGSLAASGGSSPQGEVVLQRWI